MSLKSLDDLYSNGNISDIIITNKEKKHGLIRLKNNNYWYLINEVERLSLWIRAQTKHNASAELINIIVNTHYQEVSTITINYHQSFVFTGNINSNGLTYYIIDFLSGDIIEAIPIMFIIHYRGTITHIANINKLNANIDYINTLMTDYVNTNHILAYKQLCHSIFIQHNPVLFRDNNCVNRHYRLYEWLKKAVFVMFGNNHYLMINDSNYNSITKKKFTDKIRFVIIYPDDISEKQMLRKVDITKYNVIIIDEKLPNQYNNNKEISDICINTFENYEENLMHMLWWSLSDNN